MPLVGDSMYINTGIVINGNIDIDIGKKPNIEKITLPPPSKTKFVDSLFKIRVVSKLSFEKLNQLTKDELAQQKFVFNESGYKIEFKSVEWYGSGQYLVAKCEIEGDFNGILYLKAMPAIDTLNQILYLRDVAFDMASKQVFKQKITELIEPIISKKMEKNLRFDVSKEISLSQKAINQKLLNRTLPNIGNLKGDVKNVSIKDISITDKQIWLHTDIEAVLKLEVDFNF
jgi:hypothetical protein